jgi:hypothetical protein
MRDEVQQFVPRGLGMGKEELGDRAGMARQQFSVRATTEMVVNLLANLLGGEFLMTKRRPEVNTDQACDLSDLQPHAAVGVVPPVARKRGGFQVFVVRSSGELTPLPAKDGSVLVPGFDRSRSRLPNGLGEKGVLST